MDGSESDDTSSSSSTSETKISKKKLQTIPDDAAENVQISIEENLAKSLIQKIKDICSIHNLNLSAENDAKILSFLTNANTSTLCIAQNTCDYGVPDTKTTFVYFTRVKQIGECVKELNEANFLNHFVYGCVDECFENSLLVTLKYIFTGAIYVIETLPYYIRSRCARQFESISSHLNELVLTSSGLGGFYLPELALIKDLTSRESYLQTTDILSLYEDCVAEWIGKIKTTICDEEVDYLHMKKFDLAALHSFWIYKQENVQQMKNYADSRYCAEIIEFLGQHNSVYVKCMAECRKSFEINIEKVTQTVRFVELMKEICDQMDDVSVKDLPSIFPRLLSYIKVIFDESEYFSSTEHKILLLTCATRQITNFCEKNITVERIFDGETEQPMDCMVDSIASCHLFEEALLQCEMFTAIDSSERDKIIDQIDQFIHRCTNMLYICSTINIFNNASKIQTEQNSETSVEEKMKTISESFTVSIDEFRAIGDDIFAFQNDNWFKYYSKFQTRMQQIGNEIENLVDTNFESISNVEDAVDILRITYQYSRCHHLKRFFVEKYEQVAKLIGDELKDVETAVALIEMNSSSRHNQDRFVLYCFRRKQRIQYLIDFMRACAWLTRESAEFSRSESSYEELIAKIDSFLIRQYKKWLENWRSSVFKRLKRPLIRRCLTNDNLFEVNLDERLLKIVSEIRTWTKIGFVPTADTNKLLNLCEHVPLLRANVQELVLTRNQIYTCLDADEKGLFSIILKRCSDFILPALYTLTWDAEGSNKTILSYLKQVHNVEKTIRNYKLRNESMIELCKSICTHNILNFTTVNLTEMMEEADRTSLIFFKKITSVYDRLSHYVGTLFESFGNIEELSHCWNAYVKKIDSMFAVALKYCLKHTLGILLNNISPDEDSAEIKMQIKITATVDNDEIILVPSTSNVSTSITDFILQILQIIKLLPRLLDRHKLSAVTTRTRSYAGCLIEDAEIINLRSKIDTVLKNNIEQMEKCVENWKPLEKLWKAKNHRDDSISYARLAEEMETRNDVEIVSMFVVDISKLRHQTYVSRKNISNCNKLDSKI